MFFSCWRPATFMIFTYMFTCFFTLEIFVGITERKKPKLPPGPRRMSARTCSRKLFGYECGYRSVIVFVQSWNLRFKQWLASTLSHLRCEHWSKLKGKSTHTGSFNKQRFLYSDFLLLKGWPLNPPGTGRNASKDLLCQRLDEVSLNLNLAKKALIP